MMIGPSSGPHQQPHPWFNQYRSIFDQNCFNLCSLIFQPQKGIMLIKIEIYNPHQLLTMHRPDICRNRLEVQRPVYLTEKRDHTKLYTPIKLSEVTYDLESACLLPVGI